MSNSIILKPGTYVLTKDVTNPKPDLRHRHDWRYEREFKAGRYFVVEYQNNEAPELGIQIRAQNGYCHQTVGHESYALRDAIVFAGLKRVEEAPSDLLRRRGWSGLGIDVLDRLVKQGLITTDQVNEALNLELGEEAGNNN